MPTHLVVGSHVELNRLPAHRDSKVGLVALLEVLHQEPARWQSSVCTPRNLRRNREVKF